jgi:hypothetical protein
MDRRAESAGRRWRRAAGGVADACGVRRWQIVAEPSAVTNVDQSMNPGPRSAEARHWYLAPRDSGCGDVLMRVLAGRSGSPARRRRRRANRLAPEPRIVDQCQRRRFWRPEKPKPPHEDPRFPRHHSPAGSGRTSRFCRHAVPAVSGKFDRGQKELKAGSYVFIPKGGDVRVTPEAPSFRFGPSTSTGETAAGGQAEDAGRSNAASCSSSRGPAVRNGKGRARPRFGK